MSKLVQPVEGAAKGIIAWEDPPANRLSQPRQAIDDTYDTLKSQPGRWALIDEVEKGKSPGKWTHWKKKRPGLDFTVRRTQNGTTKVWARYDPKLDTCGGVQANRVPDLKRSSADTPAA